ncbi:unnamed protein product, partial [Porites lobata]
FITPCKRRGDPKTKYIGFTGLCLIQGNPKISAVRLGGMYVYGHYAPTLCFVIFENFSDRNVPSPARV